MTLESVIMEGQFFREHEYNKKLDWGKVAHCAACTGINAFLSPDYSNESVKCLLL